MKIAILDSDKYFCDKIKKLIIENSQVSGFDIDIYENPHLFLEKKNNYGLLFLEMDLPGIDGINVARELKSNQIIIVFLAKSYNRIIEAIGINIAGYIIKNHLEVELKNILKEVFGYMNNNQIIILTKRNDVYFYDSAEILFFEYMNKHLYVYKKNGNDDLGYIPIKEIIKTLPTQFVQVNKNQIINIDKIAFMRGMKIKLRHSNVIIEVSRRKRREVFELMIRAINRI